jgi:hypothetical protein
MTVRPNQRSGVVSKSVGLREAAKMIETGRAFDSMTPNSLPVALSRERIGLFHPSGASMLRNRL